LIDASFSRIPKANDPKEELPYRGSVEEHQRLLDLSSALIDGLAMSPIIQQVASATLLHPDFHKRNIFVSENDSLHVTAIIDWQSTCIEPAFVYANETPDLVEDPATDIQTLKKFMSRGVDTTADSSEGIIETPEEAAARKRYEKDVLTCRKTFEVVQSSYMKKISEARAMDQTLLRPFRYCDASWRDSAAALRQELIDLSQNWTNLGLPASCKYQPTPEELTEHKKQYEDFETVQQLKIFLKHVLNVDSDGWVPANEWERTKEDHRNILSQWLESIKEPGGSEDRARKLWPFHQTTLDIIN